MAVRLAIRQHGVFARHQLLAAGVQRSSIDRRLASRTWIRVDASVYALPSHPRTWLQRVTAATLGQPGSVASGWTAAALWEIGDAVRSGSIEITVPIGAHHGSRIARVRRSTRAQRRTQLGLPVTSPQLTVVDLAGRVDALVLGRLLDDALRKGLCRTDHVGEWVVRLAGSRHAGIGNLRRLLLERGHGYVVPESVLESRLFETMSTPGIPELLRQQRFPWRPQLPNRVDALAADLPLILEADGRDWHARFEQMAADRKRDAVALRHGHLTMRFTHLHLTEEAESARDDVRAVVEEWGPRLLLPR